MQRIAIHKPGSFDRLKLVEAPDLSPGPGEVVVDTRAVGVNFADVVVRLGLYESAKKYVGFPITPGFEFSGEVSALGAGVSHQQTRTPAEFDEAFLSYASSGYELVFAHGFEYQDAAMRAGERFPETTFIVSGGGRFAENVVPLIFELEEGSYLAGMLAAGMSETGIVGMVGGVEIPPVQGTFRAFEAGARAVDPDVQILESFTGNWDDVAAAKEAAVAQLSRGADVLIHNVDAASFGVFQAVREAVAAGRTAWALGMNRDQNDVAPDVILGSAVIRIPEAFLDIARTWQAICSEVRDQLINPWSLVILGASDTCAGSCTIGADVPASNWSSTLNVSGAARSARRSSSSPAVSSRPMAVSTVPRTGPASSCGTI